MKLSFSAADEQFREEVAHWLQQNLQGEFEPIRYRGGPGDEHIVGHGKGFFHSQIIVSSPSLLAHQSPAESKPEPSGVKAGQVKIAKPMTEPCSVEAGQAKIASPSQC